MSRKPQFVDGRYRQCPSCPGMMRNSSRQCSVCTGMGRPAGTDIPYAIEIGITVRKLRQMGGEARFRSMDPDCRALLLKPDGRHR